MHHPFFFHFFFFHDTATTEIYTLSLHDALPISNPKSQIPSSKHQKSGSGGKEATNPKLQKSYLGTVEARARRDRKSTRLNSSHANISYAVFCLKKKKKRKIQKIMIRLNDNIAV